MQFLIIYCLVTVALASSRIETQQGRSEDCDLPAESGMCYAYLRRFYYNSTIGKCQRFVYGGCGGNKNNFRTLAECEKNCQKEKKTCVEEPEIGMCRGYFPSYYYDAKTRSCRKFIYGGCQGNGNRYLTEEECLDNCKDVVVSGSQSVCELPAETGSCRGFFRRFYFDSTTGRCQRFVYGGCGGNENNFESINECNQRCGKRLAASACEEDVEVGSCKAAFHRYFFNKKTGKCEEFIYGGCDGNSNNFNTKEECEDVCSG